MSDGEKGNEELAKLVEARRRFLDGFHEATREFEGKLEDLRDAYLEEITYTALNDPYLVEVQKVLRAKAEKAMAQRADDEEPPEAEPKAPVCPNCDSEIRDENAAFCGQCGYPLKEEKVNAAGRMAGSSRKFNPRHR